MRRFVSPSLAPGKYTYTIKAIIPGPNGPRTVTTELDVRPGDFESIDLRGPGERPVADVEYEPTPQKVVDALLRLGKVTKKDVLWDLGCGDGRIPVTAAKEYGCKACGFDIDPDRVKDLLANARKNGVERLVAIEKRDISRRPEERSDRRHALPAAALERQIVAAAPQVAAGGCAFIIGAPNG